MKNIIQLYIFVYAGVLAILSMPKNKRPLGKIEIQYLTSFSLFFLALIMANYFLLKNGLTVNLFYFALFLFLNMLTYLFANKSKYFSNSFDNKVYLLIIHLLAIIFICNSFLRELPNLFQFNKSLPVLFGSNISVVLLWNILIRLFKHNYIILNYYIVNSLYLICMGTNFDNLAKIFLLIFAASTAYLIIFLYIRLYIKATKTIEHQSSLSENKMTYEEIDNIIPLYMLLLVKIIYPF